MKPSVAVYQMTYRQGTSDNNGLVFTSEEKYDNQSILFAIPIAEDYSFRHPMSLINYLENIRIIFPFQLNEEYYELEGKINFPKVIFNIPKTDQKITFEIENQQEFYWRILPFKRRRFPKLDYVGEKNHLIESNNGFLILRPIELYKMDELYLKHKAVCVGLTPNFGNLDNIK